MSFDKNFLTDTCESIMPVLGHRCQNPPNPPIESPHSASFPDGSSFIWEDSDVLESLGIRPGIQETRIIDPETGGMKGSKIERHDLIPTGVLGELAVHFGRGEEKYPSEAGIPNWRRGYAWSLSYAAMQRHLRAFWDGEDFDPETGSKHLIAAAWHCMTLATFMDEHPEKDDRYSTIKGTI